MSGFDDRPLGPDALERLLRHQPAPPPSRAFQARLRRAFAQGFPARTDETRSQAGRASRSSAEAVSHASAPVPLSQLERDLARLPVAPPPRPEFQAALRTRFVAGASELAGQKVARPMVVRRGSGIVSDGVRGDERARAREGAARAARRRRNLRWMRGVVAAAAAVLLFAVFLPREPVWHVRLLEGEGVVSFGPGKETLDLADLGGLALPLFLGGEFRSLDNLLEFTLGDELVLDVLPGTTIHALSMDARPSAGRWELAVLEGELYLHKNPATKERPFDLRTRDAVVQVLGTTVGVLQSSSYTCVCVSNGTVAVTPLDEQLSNSQSVTAGESLVLESSDPGQAHRMPFPALRCPDLEPHDHHVCRLEAFDARTR